MQINNEPVAYVDNVWINRPDLAMDLGIGQMFSRCQLSDHQIPLYTHPANEAIYLSKAEIESGLSRVKWAELLIKQLPKEHEGRNSWLLNYGGDK